MDAVVFDRSFQIDRPLAWKLIRGVRALADAGALDGVGALCLCTTGQVRRAAIGEPALLHVDPASVDWETTVEVSEEAGQWFDLYLPLATVPAGASFVVGHLGQSLDGRIATENGGGEIINGPENLTHLHCMRALSDAVIVGAETVLQDDPRLTTRRVEGGNPVRVVLDPRRRLPIGRNVFRDGEAETLLLCNGASAESGLHERAECLAVPCDDDVMPASAVRDALHARGLSRLFIEGGGVTVSRFLNDGVLDRLQIAIAPLIIGAGRMGVSLPPVDHIDAARRPRHRTYAMGSDTLFDCDLTA